MTSPQQVAEEISLSRVPLAKSNTYQHCRHKTSSSSTAVPLHQGAAPSDVHHHGIHEGSQVNHLPVEPPDHVQLHERAKVRHLLPEGVQEGAKYGHMTLSKGVIIKVNNDYHCRHLQ